MWETIDPDGRRVVLTVDAWQHIVEEHRELELQRELILTTVGTPDRRLAGRRPFEEWFYVRTARPTRWLKVVVHFERGEGRIVTAFPRRRLP